MKEYLRAVNKTNEVILKDKFISNNELERFSKSDYRWASNKEKIHTQRTIHKGDIFQFEFGKNYSPEMSYEHRGLVIGVKNKLLYVLPICSYDEMKHPDVFHPTDNSASKSDWYLLKASEYSFIQHDSVLKLNDLRTVSVNRILYHQKDGKIDCSSEVYRCIEKLVITKCFPSFMYEFEKMLEQNTILKKKCEEQEGNINNLQKSLSTIYECLHDVLEDPDVPEEVLQKIKEFENNKTVKENT